MVWRPFKSEINFRCHPMPQAVRPRLSKSGIPESSPHPHCLRIIFAQWTISLNAHSLLLLGTKRRRQLHCSTTAVRHSLDRIQQFAATHLICIFPFVLDDVVLQVLGAFVRPLQMHSRGRHLRYPHVCRRRGQCCEWSNNGTVTSAVVFVRRRDGSEKDRTITRRIICIRQS